MRKKKVTNLPENLKTWLRHWGMTQIEMQKLLGLKDSVLSSYIQGKALPQLETMIKMESITAVPIYTWVAGNVTAEMLPPRPLELYKAPQMVSEERLEGISGAGKYPDTAQLQASITHLRETIEKIRLRMDTMEEKSQ